MNSITRKIVIAAGVALGAGALTMSARPAVRSGLRAVITHDESSLHQLMENPALRQTIISLAGKKFPSHVILGYVIKGGSARVLHADPAKLAEDPGTVLLISDDPDQSVLDSIKRVTDDLAARGFGVSTDTPSIDGIAIYHDTTVPGDVITITHGDIVQTVRPM